MIFTWLKRRRRKGLRQRPFPDAWDAILKRNIAHYDRLSDVEQAKLRADIQIFVAEKNWEGCGGLTLTDEVKVTIAAQACLLVLGFDEEYFELVQSILVYPDAYVAPGETITKGGLVLEEDSHREGEAWYRGPVIVSWADVLASGRQEKGGDNLVLHEFAHQLDMQNGRFIDGTPDLATADQYRRWQEVIQHEYEQLIRDCHSHRRTLLDCYGTTDLGEFFAVATECFFEQPQALSRRHPALYAILREYFQQDPASRCSQAKQSV